MRPADIGDGKPYTHIEIDPSLILGVLAGSIPFSDHNQAPRNTYQSAMGKQAIGLYSTRYQDRYDTMAHTQNYSQRPLVYTQTGRLTKIDNMPCGINVIAAIGVYTGYNQEDSIMMNESSVQRGMFSSTFYRTYKEQNNKNHSSGEEEFFCRPDHQPQVVKNMKPHNYDKLAEDGFVPVNTFVDNGDIIIGKCMADRDTSVVLKGSERGFVDRNCHGDSHFTNVNGDGYNFCKVCAFSEKARQKPLAPASHVAACEEFFVIVRVGLNTNIYEN
jgi:DNA-directed RNA polymerase II subunit RPB2